MKLRTIIFWCHLSVAVCAGLVILLMSVTGVLLMYERQMIAWSVSDLRSAPAGPSATRLSPEMLLARVRTSHPDLEPTVLTYQSAADAPVAMGVGQRTLFVDAYSGAVLGEGSQTMRRAMSELRAWHRWLAVEGEGRPVARAITGWSNVIFLFIVVSGVYLWFPRQWTWRHVKSVTLFNPRAQGKARDFNWHHVIGSWCSIPLFIMVLSAVPISFSWFSDFIYRAVGEAPPRPAAQAARPAGTSGGDAVPAEAAEPQRSPLEGIDTLWARAEQHVDGWTTIALRLPSTADGPLSFAIDRGDGGQPQLRSTLVLDRVTGGVVTNEAFADLTPGRRIRNVMRFAHTGEVLGLPGQTVAGIASAGATVLVWTGLALAWRRFRAWRTRRVRTSVAAESIDTAA